MMDSDSQYTCCAVWANSPSLNTVLKVSRVYLKTSSSASGSKTTLLYPPCSMLRFHHRTCIHPPPLPELLIPPLLEAVPSGQPTQLQPAAEDSLLLLLALSVLALSVLALSVLALSVLAMVVVLKVKLVHTHWSSLVHASCRVVVLGWLHAVQLCTPTPPASDRKVPTGQGLQLPIPEGVLMLKYPFLHLHRFPTRTSPLASEQSSCFCPKAMTYMPGCTARQ